MVLWFKPQIFLIEEADQVMETHISGSLLPSIEPSFDWWITPAKADTQ